MLKVVAASVSRLQANADRVNAAGTGSVRRKNMLLTGLLSYWHEKIILYSAAIVIARERKMLLRCSQQQLQDMGITQAQADSEARRAFLDVPGDRLSMYGLLDSSKDSSVDCGTGKAQGDKP